MKRCLESCNVNKKVEDVQNVCSTSKKIRSDSILFKLDSLPSEMVHLGDENFVSVAFFLGHTRVHIRRYVADNEGYLHPTKDGVSLSPAVWDTLQGQLHTFSSYRPCDKVAIIENDVCVSKQTKNGEVVFSFQRLFQRKNLRYEFLPEHTVMSHSCFTNLCKNSDNISTSVKSHLISWSLEYYVKNHLRSLPEKKIFSYEIPRDQYTELENSLCKCMTDAIADRISELFVCFGCKEAYQNQSCHDCLMVSRAEKFEQHFEEAFYTLNWIQLAKCFVDKNNNDFDLAELIYSEEFFQQIDVNILLKNVESMYINLEGKII